MWSLLAKLVSSTLLGPLIQAGLSAYSARLNSTDLHEQKTLELAARELDIQGQEARLNAQEKVLILGRWYAIENLLGYIMVAYYGKAIFFDNVLGSIFDVQWSTPALTGATADAAALIMTFWMGTRGIQTVASIIGAAFGKR